ncbi:methyltransferase domain-containing protein [Rhodococcus sp. NPDC059234]|uniref:methyltransferase domain-containing protein n=1 Tax=Rhodococcus sp. NPDC059234 TaxID=3346781 RepID=UPI00366DCE5C
MTCRACSGNESDRVLDLGRVPAADFFPLASTPVSPEESVHPLAMDLCRSCGLAQLADDDTTADEPRGVEPQALKDQAAEAVRTVAEAGALIGDTAIEFGSPHGGSWLPMLADRGFRAPDRGARASVVLDSFGLMHEPDQRAAFRRRAEATADDGILLIQFHSLRTIIEHGQWNALRHGHFAYYSLTALRRLLAEVGMTVTATWEFDLYGGTVLVAARHRHLSDTCTADPTDQRILAAESLLGIDRPHAVSRLQQTADRHADSLRILLESMAELDRRVYGYGAASRAVALFSRAGIDRRHLAGVADASAAKQGRRMPGTDIPIISPSRLVTADPDWILLTLPDLLPEVQRQFPELCGRWVVNWAGGDMPRTRHLLAAACRPRG